MKSDFKNLKEIKRGQPLFLYGNFKRTFNAFCDFVFDKLGECERHFCTVTEALKIANSQCDLFDSRTICLCIQNVEDNHLTKLQSILYEPQYVFIMNSGDYMKSKKVTQYFTDDPKSLALPSFKNDLTLSSFCRMMLPGQTTQLYAQLIDLINKTDEDLSSLFRKMQLLLDVNSQLLNEYVTYKQSFLSDLAPIGLIRYLLQVVIRSKYMSKTTGGETSKITATAINDLIDCETQIKFGNDIPKSFIETYGNKKQPI